MNTEQQREVPLENEHISEIEGALENARIEGEKIRKTLVDYYNKIEPPTERVFHEKGVDDGFVFNIGGCSTFKRTYYVTSAGIFNADHFWNTGHDSRKRELSPIACIVHAQEIIDGLNGHV